MTDAIRTPESCGLADASHAFRMIDRDDRKIFRPCRVLAAILLLGLYAGSAWAAAPNDASAEPLLFGEVFKNIVEYHIDATQPQYLALTGLHALEMIDPAVSITQSAGRLSFRQGATLRSFATPPVNDSAAWGRLMSSVLDFARGASTAVAAIPPDQLDEKMIDTALATLDRFSRYVRPAVAREHRAERDGFDGIGVDLDARASQFWIASIQPGTPAVAAGLQIGDRILSVNGVTSATLSIDHLRQQLRGQAHTIVVLDIERHGVATPLTFSIPRAHIVEPAVTLHIRDDLAWLKVSSFNLQTAELTANLLKQAHREEGAKLRGIVLDLRNNPGGLLDQSVDLASLFLEGVPVASTIGRLPESFQRFAAPPDDDPETLPLAVLINGGSASASEVAASALQDTHRAVVIGTSSFGKGTVQTVIRTANDGELTVTWAQLITPLGYHLNRHGVVPNICTSGITAGETVTSNMLAQEMPLAPSRPRKSLDDAGWDSLRASCPAQREDRDSDFIIADRVIGNSALYSRAMGTAPARAAQTAEARITR